MRCLALVGVRGTFTAVGLLATALATTWVIKTGASATTVESSEATAPLRTVIAIPPPDALGAEVPVRVELGGNSVPQARPQVDLRQIVYTVAGNQRPDDPVTVVYADETGALVTAANVTLPWTLTLTPALPVNYVMASSRGSQLNCWITDAAGATVVSQTDFSPSTSCNR